MKFRGTLGYQALPASSALRYRLFKRNYLKQYRASYISHPFHLACGYLFKFQVAQAVIVIVAIFFFSYVYHCTWATSEAYSSPSIVLSAHGGDGSTIIFDDFREAYYWLRKNTHPVNR